MNANIFNIFSDAQGEGTLRVEIAKSERKNIFSTDAQGEETLCVEIAQE